MVKRWAQGIIEHDPKQRSKKSQGCELLKYSRFYHFKDLEITTQKMLEWLLKKINLYIYRFSQFLDICPRSSRAIFSHGHGDAILEKGR